MGIQKSDGLLLLLELVLTEDMENFLLNAPNVDIQNTNGLDV